MDLHKPIPESNLELEPFAYSPFQSPESDYDPYTRLLLRNSNLLTENIDLQFKNKELKEALKKTLEEIQSLKLQRYEVEKTSDAPKQREMNALNLIADYDSEDEEEEMMEDIVSDADIDLIEVIDETSQLNMKIGRLVLI